MNEEHRYAAVQADVIRLLDQAATDRSSGGMLGLGSVWLAAELYAANEEAHVLYEARSSLVSVLQARIQAVAHG
jgi:hypothetical protein